METQVTFRPLTGGRYRTLINGVPGDITKNPKKTRFIIVRANDPKHAERIKESQAKKEMERKLKKYFLKQEEFRRLHPWW